MSTFGCSNPFDFEPKREPAAWITWLSEPLAEAGSCLLPLHQQSRFTVPKEDSADLGDWATRHAALVEEIANNLRNRGRTVEIEKPISVVSRSGVIVSGQMDVFAPEARPNRALVVDAKTGKQRSKHWSQVLVYQALISASPEFANEVPPDGGLVYGDGTRVNIPAAECDGAFKQRLAQLLEVVASDGPAPDPIPSSACRWCRLKEWCPSAQQGRPKPPVVSEF